MTVPVVLVVEDGTEYAEAFGRLSGDVGPVELLHATHAAQARAILSTRRVDGVFLDVVFDRTPPEQLAGDRAELERRFAGDRAGALEHLAFHQGFYLLAELAPSIPAGTPVLLAHDFSSEPGRLAALQATVPGLEGVPESETTTQILRRLTRR
ncbi:MAG TPA: hypothetical protein VKG23_09235 [Thermoanaerobaculia bacterium]|nr:hypothetical protein [Thermoanaerobaculia bacterium]